MRRWCRRQWTDHVSRGRREITRGRSGGMLLILLLRGRVCITLTRLSPNPLRGVFRNPNASITFSHASSPPFATTFSFASFLPRPYTLRIPPRTAPYSSQARSRRASTPTPPSSTPRVGPTPPPPSPSLGGSLSSSALFSPSCPFASPSTKGVHHWLLSLLPPLPPPPLALRQQRRKTHSLDILKQTLFSYV